MTIQFPVYTFHFLYSSCGCSSKSPKAIEKLPVSVSTTSKVTLLISDYLAAASSPDESADALAIINIGCYSKVTATLKRYSVTIETLICGCFFYP